MSIHTQRGYVRRRLPPALAVLFALAFAGSGPAAHSGDLEWDGGNYTTRDDPTNLANLLGQSFYAVNNGNLNDPIPADNTVTVGVTPDLEGNVYGGVGFNLSNEDAAVDASNNRVILKGSVSIEKHNPNPAAFPRDTGSVYGGVSFLGNTTGNTVTLSSGYGGTVEGNVIGGSTAYLKTIMSTEENLAQYNGNATRNAIAINGGTVDGYVMGGETYHGNANQNSVAITAGTLKKSVFGGRSDRAGNADNNTVTVTGGDFATYVITAGSTNIDGGIIFGGMSELGSASGNTVSVGGAADVKSYVYGGYVEDAASTGVVSNNRVTVGVDVGKAVVGGQSSGSGAVTGNNVIITGGLIMGSLNLRHNQSDEDTSGVPASAVGGYSAGTGAVTGNGVTITGGTMREAVFGGVSFNSATASGNTVVMTGGTTHDTVGHLVGGLSRGGDAIGNKVTVSGATTVVGGEVIGSQASGGHRADNNTILISGGEIKGGVFGGKADSALTTDSASGNTITVTGGTIAAIIGGYTEPDGKTLNNTVNISGNVLFKAGALLAGGSTTTFTGNTLNTSGIGYTVDTIEKFKNYNFALSGDYNTRTVYDVATQVDLAGSNVHTTFTGEGAPLKEGEVFTLFSDARNQDVDTYTIDGRHGILFEHEAEYETQPTAAGQLNIVIKSTKVATESQIPGQSQLAGLQLINAASDLAQDIHGLFDVAEIRQRYQDADPCGVSSGRWVAFAGAGGGTSKWDTGNSGSKIDMNYVSAVAGVGRRAAGFLLAGFFETGWGRYDVRQNGTKHTKDEDARYIGGGALIRWEHAGFYAQATGHAGSGRVELDALINGATNVDYTMKSAYFGADATIGHKWILGCSSLDLSARYSWNRLKGDDLKVGLHDVAMDSVDSHRVRAGARWTYGGNVVSPYAGAHFQYETDSKTTASAYGFDLHQSKMRGATGIGELGVHIGDTMNRVGLDVGVEAYVGKRKGVTGKAMLGVSF